MIVIIPHMLLMVELQVLVHRSAGCPMVASYCYVSAQLMTLGSADDDDQASHGADGDDDAVAVLVSRPSTCTVSASRPVSSFRPTRTLIPNPILTTTSFCPTRQNPT